MITALFIIGALTSLGCGANIVTTKAPWKQDLVWTFGGLIGAVMMVAAVYIERLS